jgi:hypothetical protein
MANGALVSKSADRITPGARPLMGTKAEAEVDPRRRSMEFLLLADRLENG